MFLGNVQWTNTPSYQHMTVWGLALLLAGFAMLLRKAPASGVQRLWTALLISSGGLILAAAKIPAAMAAAAVTLAMVFFAGGPDSAARWRMLGLIVLAEIALLAIVAVFVSPSHIVEVLREGLSLRSGYGGLPDVLWKHFADIAGMPARFILIIAIVAASILAVAGQQLAFAPAGHADFDRSDHACRHRGLYRARFRCSAAFRPSRHLLSRRPDDAACDHPARAGGRGLPPHGSENPSRGFSHRDACDSVAVDRKPRHRK